MIQVFFFYIWVFLQTQQQLVFESLWDIISLLPKYLMPLPCLGNLLYIVCVSWTLKQKYSVAGSSQFAPSLNAITSNQDLQWMLQPSILGTPGPSRALRPPYPLLPRMPSMNPQLSQSHLSRPGVIRAAVAVGSSTRSRNYEHVSPI